MAIVFQTEIHEYEENGQRVLEEIQLDYQREAEIIHYGDTGSNMDGAVLVLDYKRVSVSYTVLEIQDNSQGFDSELRLFDLSCLKAVAPLPEW